MKKDCNKLSIGEPGTEHIKWKCAGAFIAENMMEKVSRLVNLWTKKSSRKAKPASAAAARPFRPGASLRRSQLATAALAFLVCAFQSGGSLLTATVTNQLTGRGDTNVIRAIPLNDFTPVLADGTWVSKGVATRIAPNTNGTFTFWSAPGFWAFTNVNGLNMTVGFYDTSSNATAYVISGGRNFYAPTTIVITNGNGSSSGGVTNGGGVLAGWLTNATFSATGTNAIQSVMALPGSSAYGVGANFYISDIMVSAANGWVSFTNFNGGIRASNFVGTVGASNIVGIINATAATNAPDGNRIASLNQVTNIVSAATNGFVTASITNGFVSSSITNGLASMTAATNIANAQIAASGAVTNDSIALSFIASRPSMLPEQQQAILGSVGELQSAGIRGNLVDIWPLTTIQGGVYGTNQTSLYQRPWIGWNQARSGPFTNRPNLLTGSNVISLPTITGPWTLCFVSREPWCFDGNGSSGNPTSYRGLELMLNDSNGNAYIAIAKIAPDQESIVVKRGADLVNYNNTQFGSNTMKFPSSGGYFSSYQNFTPRKTTIISFDGTNTLWSWWNGEPAAFCMSNSSSWVRQKYVVPVDLNTNTFNQLCLGYNATWATELPNTGYGFAGHIDSVMLFTNLFGTNVIDSAGNCSVWPAATAIARAARWLEPSKESISYEGTSMMAQVYSVGNLFTNELWQMMLARNPSLQDMQVLARAGSQLQLMTNFGSSTVNSGVNAKFTDAAMFKMPTNRFNCVPAWVRYSVLTDHPRNDNNISESMIQALFNNYYGPLKQRGIRIKFTTANTDGSSLNTAAAIQSVFECMKTNRVIDEYLSFHKYCNLGGIINMTNTALSNAAHFNGSDQNLVSYVVNQWCNLVFGLPVIPPPVGYTGIVNQWPTYSVTLSGNPANFTNVYATPVIVNYSGGTVTGISVNGFSSLLPTTAGTITLQPFEWMQFTNSGVPSFTYKPVP